MEIRIERNNDEIVGQRTSEDHIIVAVRKTDLTDMNRPFAIIAQIAVELLITD